MTMLILQAVFNTLVHLVVLSTLTLSVSYGSVYWTAFRKGGWGSCSRGFTRYARDMFWQSLFLTILFGAWGVRLYWNENPIPIWDRGLGPLTVIATVGLYLVSLDMIRDRLISRTPPHIFYWTAAVMIIVGNLAAVVLQR